MKHDFNITNYLLLITYKKMEEWCSRSARWSEKLKVQVRFLSVPQKYE